MYGNKKKVRRRLCKDVMGSESSLSIFLAVCNGFNTEAKLKQYLSKGKTSVNDYLTALVNNHLLIKEKPVSRYAYKKKENHDIILSYREHVRNKAIYKPNYREFIINKTSNFFSYSFVFKGVNIPCIKYDLHNPLFRSNLNEYNKFIKKVRERLFETNIVDNVVYYIFSKKYIDSVNKKEVQKVFSEDINCNDFQFSLIYEALMEAKERMNEGSINEVRIHVYRFNSKIHSKETSKLPYYTQGYEFNQSSTSINSLTEVLEDFVKSRILKNEIWKPLDKITDLNVRNKVFNSNKRVNLNLLMEVFDLYLYREHSEDEEIKKYFSTKRNGHYIYL